jgi:dTDP-L-rhamnose 4-epimerase
VIVHLAAETGTAQSPDGATRHAHVNVVGTTQLLDALGRQNHVPAHVLLSGPRAVYGEGMWRNADGTVFTPGMRSHAQFERAEWDFRGATPLPSAAATTVPAPTSVYGATKLAREHILAAWAGARDLPLSVLRFQNAYGPRQSVINPYTGIVSMFSQWAKDGQSIPVYEDGGADAEYHGAPAPHINGKYRDGDVRNAECAISAAKAEFGCAPYIDLAEGISRLQDWIASEHALSWSSVVALRSL